MKTKAIALEIIIAVLALFWVYAGITKLLDFDTYWRQVAHYIHSTMIAKTLALVLPSIQLLVAVGLLFQTSRKNALFISWILLLFFTGYIIYLLYIADVTPCSCTGIIPGFNWLQHFFFNVVFMLITIAGIAMMPKDLLTNRHHMT